MGYPSLATGALIGWELLQRKAHIFIRFTADHYRPDSRPNHVYVINYKTTTGSWEPLYEKKGKPLYPLLVAELDAIFPPDAIEGGRYPEAGMVGIE